MHKIAVSLFTAAGLALAAGQASAADMPVKAPVYKAPAAVVPAYNWTGLYIGGHVGGLWTRQDIEWDPLPSAAAFGANAQAGRLSSSSFVGGVHGGYNWQFAPTWVLGVEGDSSWTSASSSTSAAWTFVGTSTPVPGSLTSMGSKLDWLSSVRGRIGYLVLPNALVYFTGGGAWGHFDYSASAFNGTTYLAATSFSKTETGYVLGGGLEWALTNNWLIRGEYLFYRLKGASSTAFAPGFPTFPSGFTWGDPDIHVARFGLTYKFDWGVPVVARY